MLNSIGARKATKFFNDYPGCACYCQIAHFHKELSEKLPYEQKAIARIIELRGKYYPYEKTASAMNRDGILTKQGKLWRKGSVFKIYKKAS